MIKKAKAAQKQDVSSQAVAPTAQRSASIPGPANRSSNQNNFIENYELPQRYNTTQVTLMPRDPYWAHAYWEISDAARDSMRKKLGRDFDRSAQVLRMYDVTCVEFNGQNANQSFDVEVDPNAQNWYMNFWKSGASYCSEIGVRTPTGDFHPFARSNYVSTPPASSPGRTDMIWMAVKENEDPQTFAFLGRQKRLRNKYFSPHKTVAPGQRYRRRKIYLSEKEVRDYYANLFPLLKILRRRRLRSKKLTLSSSQIVKLDEYLLSGLTREEFLKRRLLRGAGPSAQIELENQPGGASENLFSGSSDTVAGKQRKFFFEIWTELLVYGRTEPDAEVKLNSGEIIKLRPDGTFSLRYALPDGKIPFDFVATSADKIEQRRIVTAVERTKTMYSP